MSVGTSDTTVISSTKTEARNLNDTDASVATRDGSSPANNQANTAQNHHNHIRLTVYLINLAKNESALVFLSRYSSLKQGSLAYGPGFACLSTISHIVR